MAGKLTEGSVAKHLIKLTVPMIGGVFSVIAFNLADTYFVSQIGTAQLAAMSFTFPVVSALGSLSLGLGIGASSIVARAIGEGDPSQVRRLTTDSLMLSFLIVVIFSLIGLVTIDPIFTSLGAQPELMPLIRQYMQIWYWGMMFLVVPMVGNSLIRATGNSKVASLIMVVAAVVNVVLDPIFIFGWGWLPRLELQGAAIATVISRAITLIASLLFLHYYEGMLSFTLPSWKTLYQSWKTVLYVGLLAAATNVITPVSVGVITRLVAVYGSKAVAGFGIASRLEAFSLLVLMALSAIIGPFVGQNWGAKQYERVYMAVRQSFLFCLGWGVLLALVLWGMGEWLVSGFNRDSDVIEIASRYLYLVPISYGGFGVILIASAAFNALGKPLPSTVMTVARMLVLYLPLAYLGSQLWGIGGIFLAGCFSNLIVGCAAFYWTEKVCISSHHKA